MSGRQRIFGATIFFGTDSTRGRARVVHRARFNFLREAQIWYDRTPAERDGAERFENVIVLSDEFYSEIMDHPIPTDIDAVKVLASAPAVLRPVHVAGVSLFSFKARGEDSVVRGLRPTAQLGSVEYSRPRRFRAMLEQWLSTIHLVWPECPAKISPDGMHLRVAPARAVLEKVG